MTNPVYTDTPQVSEIVQREAFSRGCYWHISGQGVSHVGHNYLYPHLQRAMSYGDSEGVARSCGTIISPFKYLKGRR